MRILLKAWAVAMGLAASALALAQAPGAAATGPAGQAGAGGLMPNELRLARYTTQSGSLDPQTGQPLAVVATVSFPRGQIRSVGDAVTHLLARTGYALVPAAQLDDSARRFLELPLPESHRRLGPYRVDEMLQVLLGDAWSLEVDPLQRSVRFQADGCAEDPATTAELSAARR
jgi:conjugative transfer region protein (TIGR03748 family)